MKNTTFTLIVILITTYVAEAQITFEKTYGSSSTETAKSIRQTNDGGYIIGGTNLVKIDESGSEEWTQPNYSLFANPTSDDGYILINHNNTSAIFTKVAQDGTQLWQTYYSGGHWANEGKYIEEAEDGYIVTGRYQSVTGSGMMLLKLDLQGNSVWRRAYTTATSAGFNYGFSTQQTNDKGYIIAGYSNVNFYDSTRHQDVFILKTDSLGTEQWRKFFGGNADDFGTFIRQDNDGNYWISGTSKSFSTNNNADMYLIKLDSNGTELWTKTYGGNADDEANALWITNDNGCIIVGKSNSFSNGDFDGYIVKTDTNGDTLWTKTYGGNGEEDFKSIQQITDDGYIIAGLTNSQGAGDFDMWLLKTDSLGKLASTSTIGQNPNDIINYSVYPNPNNGIFTIEANFNISTIEVFNALGKMVYSKDLNTSNTTINLSNQAKGVYFYRLKLYNESIIKSGKFIIK
ncbi:MAG: T9SS type A sorting domain-containing protein [Saprospiraceae bacterium]